MRKCVFVWAPWILIVTASPDVLAKPRVPVPPVPEGELAAWRFNGFDQRKPLFDLNTKLVDGWSGLALQLCGAGPALFALPAISSAGETNLAAQTGTLRLWFAPEWSSASVGGRGPGTEAVLFQTGSWSDKGIEAGWTLSVTPEGNTLHLHRASAAMTGDRLQAGIVWYPGEWHQVALAWSPTSTALYLDGQLAAKGPAVSLAPPVRTFGIAGFGLGSGGDGEHLAQGQLDEVYSFPRFCEVEELARNWSQNAPVAALGPVTPEEEALRKKALAAMRSTRSQAARLQLLSTGCQSDGVGGGPYACNLGLPLFTNIAGNRIVKLAVRGAADNWNYDLYMATNLTDFCDASGSWSWQAHGTNGQILSVTNPPTNQVFFVLRSPLATNVLVNDPAQDEGNLQNTQSETTLVAFSNTVIVAWVDSNLGVCGYGSPDSSAGCEDWLPSTSARPDFIGWAVSHDGGATFTDKTNLPLFRYLADGVTNYLGNAGDPVVARDTSSGVIYIVGNPEKPSWYYPDGSNSSAKVYMPLWRSTNNGDSFAPPINATPGLDTGHTLDKPWLVVDNYPGQAQGNVYLGFNDAYGRIHIYMSPPPGTNWHACTNFPMGEAHLGALAVSSNHQVYAVIWLLAGSPIVTNGFWLSVSAQGGTNFTTPTNFLTLHCTNTYLGLRRSSSAPPDDVFRTPMYPSVAANPRNANHLCLVYPDWSEDHTDRGDVYFTQTTNGGGTWALPIKVNNDSTANDQWQPVMTFKPDGTQLFFAWYDRRNDVQGNSMIQTYGAIAKLPITNELSIANNFLISSAFFPAVFTGSTMNGTNQFDTAYPPHVRLDGTNCPNFFGNLAGHMGDYDAAVADNQCVYYTWGDNRETCTFTNGAFVLRHQADVRFVKLPWPR